MRPVITRPARSRDAAGQCLVVPPEHGNRALDLLGGDIVDKAVVADTDR
ncbi:hypothetical protein I551_0906 [Mycobacterium ulcerans str. Harvey]|uniref:Uncharacterized protein n=1 Tax=Mycobacterium ulcerans str. Harvey TaxID=1299332 RepID=A0ABP3AP05_MYCUL|nr:hypothetical protein I551_0906 [Mycobacterium ulcerans str. Harvey]